MSKLLYQKNSIQIFEYSEKAISIFGKKEELAILYERNLLSRRSYFIRPQNRRGYFSPKYKLSKVLEVLGISETNSEKTEFKKQISIPKINSVSVDKSILDSDQKRVVSFVEQQMNDLLSGKISLSDLANIKITAQPGAGKTFTLIQKILVETLIPSLYSHKSDFKILVTTFTNSGVEAIIEKIKQSKYSDLIEKVDIQTVHSIGYYALKNKYPKWQFDIETAQLNIDNIFSEYTEKNNYQKNENKIKEVMWYLNIDTYYKLNKYTFTPERYNYFLSIINKSFSYLIEDENELYDFLKENGAKESDYKLFAYIFEKIGFENFEKRTRKYVNNFIYDTLYKPLVSLCKNYMVTDISEIPEIITKHKTNFYKFLKNNEITDEHIENAFKILKTSDIFHTIKFKSYYNNDYYHKYYFDYNDFCRIPVLENLLPNQKYDFILIDEAQDLTHSQWEYIKNLQKNFGSKIYMIGDVNQSIYFYSGSDEGFALKEFKADKEFELKYNHRSSKTVIRTYNNIINVGTKIPDNAIEGSFNLITLSKALENIKDKDAILCPTNSDVFEITCSLILKDKKTYMRENTFNQKMYPLYLAINKSENIEQVLNFYEKKINERKSKLNDDEYDFLLTKYKSYQKIIFTLLQQFYFITKTGEIMDNSIQCFVDKIKSNFIPNKDGIQVLTFFQSKGLEFNDVYIYKYNSLNEEWKNRNEYDKRTNTRLDYVINSRAKINIFYIK